MAVGVDDTGDDPLSARVDHPRAGAGMRHRLGGVSDYDGEDIRLKFASKDARDFARAVEIAAGRMFGPENVTIEVTRELAMTAGAGVAPFGIDVGDDGSEEVSETGGQTALLSAVVYVAIYTPLKRVTTLNTIVGAVSGALPPMIGCPLSPSHSPSSPRPSSE